MTSNRLGEKNVNRYGSEMTIIEYNGTRDITVMFEEGFCAKTQYINFQTGHVKNPYDKSVYGVGYVGEGIYKPKFNKERTPEYSAWQGLLKRCYDEKYHKKQPTYIECTVAEEWHNFQEFARWFNENYYEVDGQRMCLDKDILIKGNKVYSQETCIFVPQNINNLFTKRESQRGDLPIGVTFHKKSNKFTSQVNNGSGLVYLGLFENKYDAFRTYKTYKENIIKDIAEKYKNIIPEILYNSLIHYEVKYDD